MFKRRKQPTVETIQAFIAQVEMQNITLREQMLVMQAKLEAKMEAMSEKPQKRLI